MRFRLDEEEEEGVNYSLLGGELQQLQEKEIRKIVFTQMASQKILQNKFRACVTPATLIKRMRLHTWEPDR